MTERINPLNTDDLTAKIFQRQKIDYRSPYSYQLDGWFFAFKGQLELSQEEALPFDQVSKHIDGLLQAGLRLAYWSGGFDLGRHSNTIGNFRDSLPGDVKVVVGIEPDSFIERKGRAPQFDQITRLSAVGLLLKSVEKLGFVFPIPELNEEEPAEFYNLLIETIGIYRREGCFHLYSPDDPAKEIKIARMLNPKPWCELELMKDKNNIPYSTSRLLGLEM
jgi:hypothetical protein